MAGRFILQVVGITPGRVLCRPSVKNRKENLADVLLLKNSTYILTHAPSYSCTGLANSGCDVYVAPCPPEDNEYEEFVNENGDIFTHTIFLADYKETPDNEQIIGINPKVAIELMESVIEKNLISCLPNIKQFKRNVPMFLKDKVNSCFDVVGFCEDDVPFVMEISNVPFAEYRPEDQAAEKALYEAHLAKKAAAAATAPAAGTAPAGTAAPAAPAGTAAAAPAAAPAPAASDDATPTAEEEEEYIYCPYLKTAYFPEFGNKTITPTMIKRINELAMIAKESTVRCVLGYIVERTDINKFEISKHHPEYYAAVLNAVNCGVHILPIVVSWTPEGVCFFVTDQLTVIRPN